MWIPLFLIVLYHRDQITVENIANYTPGNQWLAVAVMLVLFALKGSLASVIYGGILFAASGIMFPLPMAIGVNLAGSVIMTTIPYLIGSHYGRTLLTWLYNKQPRLRILSGAVDGNHFIVTILLRMMGCLPADFVGMYLGAHHFRYSPYIAGTILGFLPSIILFSVMGMSAKDIHSPAFRISFLVEFTLTILSILLYILWKKRKSNSTSTQEKTQ